MKTSFRILLSILALTTSTVSLAEDFSAGILIPLSGPAAEYGVAIRNGITLAQKERPADFERCPFHFDDSLYEPKQALSSFRNFVSVKNVKIVYAFGSPIGEAIAPVAEHDHVPFLTDGVDSRISEGRRFVLRYSNPGAEYGRALAEELRKLGKHRVRIVKAENQYLESLVQGFIEAARGGPMSTEVIASVTPQEGDMRFVVPKVLQQKEFDALGVFLMPGQSSNLLVNLKGKLPKPLVIGGDFFESPAEVEASKGMLEGALYPNNLIEDSFRERYTAEFKSTAQVKFGAEGYDVANLLMDLFCGKSPAASPEGIVEALESSGVRKGAQGTTEFVRSERGDKFFAAPVVIMEVKNGHFVPRR